MDLFLMVGGVCQYLDNYCISFILFLDILFEATTLASYSFFKTSFGHIYFLT